jgi:uncharacterized membrane protein HdeD (DUF308 family)
MRHYVEGRLFEWVMATAMVLLAVQTFAWPRTLGASAFHLLTEAIPSEFIGAFLLMFGVARIAALIANGRSRVYGPWVRATGALGGAVLWAQFELALLGDLSFDKPPSPGIPFWFAFILAELYSGYRAASDARS